MILTEIENKLDVVTRDVKEFTTEIDQVAEQYLATTRHLHNRAREIMIVVEAIKQDLARIGTAWKTQAEATKAAQNGQLERRRRPTPEGSSPAPTPPVSELVTQVAKLVMQQLREQVAMSSEMTVPGEMHRQQR